MPCPRTGLPESFHFSHLLPCVCFSFRLRNEDNQHNGSLVMNVIPETRLPELPASSALNPGSQCGLRPQPSMPPLLPGQRQCGAGEITWALMPEDLVSSHTARPLISCLSSGDCPASLGIHALIMEMRIITPYLRI